MNVVILSVVAGVFLFIFLVGFRSRKARSKQGVLKETKQERLYESKEEIPKLPRNETLYHILKNSSLSVNKIGFDTNYVFEEVAVLLRNDIRASAVDVLFDIDPKLPEQLIGSPKRLSRVLINIIENAVQNSTEGVVSMQVDVVKNNGSECRVCFIVRDQGRGMDSDALDALKIDPALKAVEGKTPYGFYVANAIIEAEGGTIGVESTPGAGTSVTFEIPFKLPQTHKAQARHVPSKSCAELKAVVVVRHAETAAVLQKHLEPLMGEVMTEVQQAHPPAAETLEGYDLVIVDHRLSDRALSHALKSRGAWLVILQSVIEPVAAGEAHVAADYQLSLPFTHEHLLEMLIVLYGGEQAGEEEQAETPAEFDRFVSDAEIPVTANVSKKDFAQFRGSKLLIVEDNPINQRLISGLLGDSGIHLYFAENGLEALDVIEEEAPFDLVLMDINMPVLDGIETTRRIRAESKYDDMPVVAFTGLNLKDQIERMREAGMNAHMAKPLNIGRVYSVFNHFLPKAPAAV